MIDSVGQQTLRQTITERILHDPALPEQLRQAIRPRKGSMRRSQPRHTTTVSLVATDGGSNAAYEA